VGELATMEELEEIRGYYHEPPEGFHWEWKADAGPLGWRLLLPQEEHRCRFGAGGGGKGCGKPAVAELTRRTKGWYYCEQHLYGRRIQAGAIEAAVLVRDVDQ
jgi:hypothetical protein